MTAPELSSRLTQNAPPVCLFSENPNRLVMLWDVIRTPAGDLVRACHIFGQVCSTIREGKQPGRQTFGIVKGELELADKNCQALRLDASARQAKRTKQQLQYYLDGTHHITVEQLDVAFYDLSSRIADELSSRFVFMLPNSAAERFDEPLKGWEAVTARWPEIAFDIEECSRCFALERYGASVFHVLLVTEFGVIKLAALMGTPGDKPGWGSVDRLIKITEKAYANRSPLENQHMGLLEQAAPYLRTIKDRWRHKLTHVDNMLVWRDTDFSPNTAEEIISATRGLMRGLAKDLP